MAKYKILVLPSDRTGVSKFRSIDQHLKLQEKFGDDFWIDIDYSPKLNDDNYLKQYDLIHYHRTLHPDYNLSTQIIPKIKKLGITSREDIEAFVLKKVHLELYVKVDKDWRNKDGKLKKYGY